MRKPNPVLRRGLALAFVLSVGASLSASDKTRPSVSLKASPSTGFAPVRVVLTAELKGGANDYVDFYCPSVEWVWGDDTRAESNVDCEPYEAGKSEIKRRYVIDRTFRTAGNFRVEFRIKQKGKVVGSGSTTVAVRPGVRDGGSH